MKKNDMVLNFFCCIIYCLLLLCVYCTNNLIVMEILFIISYIVFFIYSKIKLKRLKYMFSSPGFIYGTVFVPYVVLAVFMFIIDNYKTRIYYFTNNLNTMLETTRVYLYTYLIFLLLLTFFNAIKKYDIRQMIPSLEQKIKRIFCSFTILDILCVVFAVLNAMKLLSYGISYFSLSTLQKRMVFSSEISHYINIFMTTYSLLVTLYFVNERKEQKKALMFFRIFFMVMYWGIFLTCERRMFVAYLVGFVILFLSKLDKVRMRSVVLTIVVVCSLLLSASFRGNITFSNHNLRDVMYMSLTEFVCTYSVSNYYVNNMDTLELCYGQTYTKNALMSLFPRAIMPGKPEELGTTFKRKLNLNVAYSFNPIAEGIINFGKYAVIFVPLIIFLIVVFANKAYKFNVLMPVIISAFSIDFYRGQFANFFFDCIFCFVLLFLIFKIKYQRN